MKKTVEVERPTCPDCGTDLSRVVRVGGVRWPCPSCGGMAVELGVLQHIGVDGMATALWERSADAPSSGGPCPFCADALHVTDAAGVVLGVCRECEVAWVDTDARVRLPRRGNWPPISTAGERCGACGAPWVPNSDGSCRCCHGFDGEHDRRAAGGYMTTAG